MTAKSMRLLARRGLGGRGREVALEVVMGWVGRTRHPLPLPVTRVRKP